MDKVHTLALLEEQFYLNNVVIELMIPLACVSYKSKLGGTLSISFRKYQKHRYKFDR